MGTNSAQISYRRLIPAPPDPGIADRELGRRCTPESVAAPSDSAHSPAPHHALIDDVVRDAPTPLSLPGERVGAPTPRCIPLFASVVQCSARTPGTVCVRAPIPSFSRVCPMGHTVLPTASTVFRRFVDKCLPS